MAEQRVAFEVALGAELRSLREKRGRTRDQAVADLLHVTGTKIGVGSLLAYEHGLRQMTVARLQELATMYGVDASTVLAAAVDRTLRCPTCGRES